MTEPFTRLAIGLQTIAGFVEKLTDQGRTNRMTLLGQLTGQEACTLARPPQWRFRISAAFWINQTLQRKAEFGIYLFGSLAPTTRSPLLPFRQCLLATQVSQTTPNGRTGNAGGLGNCTHTTVPQRSCFDGCPASSRALNLSVGGGICTSLVSEAHESWPTRPAFCANGADANCPERRCLEDIGDAVNSVESGKNQSGGKAPHSLTRLARSFRLGLLRTAAQCPFHIVRVVHLGRM